MNRLTTAVDLAKRLEIRNIHGRYDAIIERARNNGYHNYKYYKIPGHPEYALCQNPKVQLAQDLGEFPELYKVVIDVANGVYDEGPDEIDKFEMRMMLIGEGYQDDWFKELSLPVPTKEERQLYLKQTKFN